MTKSIMSQQATTKRSFFLLIFCPPTWQHLVNDKGTPKTMSPKRTWHTSFSWSNQWRSGHRFSPWRQNSPHFQQCLQQSIDRYNQAKVKPRIFSPRLPIN